MDIYTLSTLLGFDKGLIDVMSNDTSNAIQFTYLYTHNCIFIYLWFEMMVN